MAFTIQHHPIDSIHERPLWQQTFPSLYIEMIQDGDILITKRYMQTATAVRMLYDIKTEKISHMLDQFGLQIEAYQVSGYVRPIA